MVRGVFQKKSNSKKGTKAMWGVNECSVYGGRGYNRARCDKCGGIGYREHWDSDDKLVKVFCDKFNGGGEIDVRMFL